MKILRYGSRGPSVQLLQTALNRAGYGPLAADGIFGFSSRPLTLIGWAGLAVLCIALLGLIATIACAAVTGVPGWLWAVCALVLLDGVILCAMGVQGAYTQRIYDEVKGRPLYIIKERQS